MNTVNSIYRAISKINPSAQVSMSGTDISAVDTIIWENGTAPIPKDQILAIIPQVELEMQQEAQAKIDNQDISAAIHNYPAALPLSDRNSSEQEKLRI
jgi:hypothetical protein